MTQAKIILGGYEKDIPALRNFSDPLDAANRLLEIATQVSRLSNRAFSTTDVVNHILEAHASEISAEVGRLAANPKQLRKRLSARAKRDVVRKKGLYGRGKGLGGRRR